MPVDIFDRHRRVVDQDADGERQSPSVMTLIVSPSTESTVSEVRMASRADRLPGCRDIAAELLPLAQGIRWP
jgi:hypothetical protein